MPLPHKNYVHSAHINNHTSHVVNVKVSYCGEHEHHEHEVKHKDNLEPNGTYFAEAHTYPEAFRLINKQIYKIQADIIGGKTLELTAPFQGLVEVHEKIWQFDIEEDGIKSVKPTK